MDETSEAVRPISTYQCNRCVAVAFYMIVFDSGDLYFCNHHFRKYEEAIRETAYYVIDDSSMASVS